MTRPAPRPASSHSPRRSRVALVAVAGNMLLQALSFASGLLAGRVLGPAGRGELAVIQTVPTLLSLLGMLGMQEAVVYFTARREHDSTSVVGSGLVLALTGSAGAALVGIPIVFFAASQMPTSVMVAALINLCLCPIGALLTVSYQPLRALGDHLSWMLFRVALAGGWVTVLVVGAAVQEPRAEHVALAYLAFQAVLAVVAFVIIRRRLGGVRVDRSLRRPLLRYGLPNVVANVPQIVNVRFDQVLIGVLLPARDLGLYVVAVGWSSIMLPLLQSVAQLLFPRLAALDGPERNEAAHRGVRLSVGVALGQTALGAVVTPLVFTIMLGRSYRDAVPVAVVLVVAGSLFGLILVVEEAMRGLGAPRAILSAELLGLVISTVALAVFLRSTGIMGAAWISVVVYAIVLGALVRALTRLTHARARDVVLPRWAELIALRSHLRGGR